MRTDREKLIELLVDVPVNYELCMRIMGHCPTIETPCYECLADYLLANGVTFATDTNVGSKWVSVEDGLPEPGVVVLVHSKLGCTYFSHRLYNHVEGKPFVIEYSGGWEVTHWMPLPEPPVEV